MAITLNDNGYAVRLAVPPQAISQSSVGSGSITALRNIGAGSVVLSTSALGTAATSGNTSAGASTPAFNAFTQSYVDQSTTLLNSSGSSGSSGVPYGGTFTFAGGINGTSSTMTIAPSSTINVVTCTPQSSLAPFVNTDNQRMVFEWTFNSGTGTSFVAVVYGANVHGNWVFGG